MLSQAIIEQGYDPSKKEMASSGFFKPVVEPIDGASSACGAVFRVQDHEIFVYRRWQAWEGACWCIIDFTAPMTGYVERRSGGIILSLMKNEDGKKIPLMPEDEEALYRYFILIVEKDVLALQTRFPYRFKVEITRLYPPATLLWEETVKGNVGESRVA